MSRISPLKDYRELAGMGSRSRLTNNPPKPAVPKYQLYERQEQLPQQIQRSRRTEERPTPDKFQRREEPRDISATRQKQRLTDNLEFKIESILKNNSHLLNENAALGELLTERNAQVEILERRLEAQMNQQVNTLNLIEIEKNKFVAEVEEKIRQRDHRVDQLCSELGHLNGQNQRLKNQLMELENSKSRELALLKDEMSRNAMQQIDNLKRAQMNSVELYELQLKKLKQALDGKQHQQEAMEHEHKLQITKLQEHIAKQSEDLKHLGQMRELELAEAKLHYDNMTDKMTRETSRMLESQRNGHEMVHRKLRKELSDKTIEVERLSHKIHKSAEDNQVEYEYLRDDKEKLELAMVELEGRLREDLNSEKHQMRQLADSEINALEDTHKQQTNALQSEIAKLIELCDQKSVQIDRLNKQADTQRVNTQQQQAIQNKLIEELRATLEQVNHDNQQELELLKVKMAQLLTGDVRTLRDYYENQLLELSEQLASLNRINQDLKKSLEREIDDRGEQRKALELELSGHKIQVAELRMKLANANLEMKESVANIGSKMELTSQTLLREAHHKERNAVILEDEKKKLHELIKAKDTEIEQLAQKIDRQKRESEEILARKELEIGELKKTSEELDGSHSKERDFFNRQLKKKEALWRQEKDQLEKELEAVKQSTYEQLKRELADLRKQNLRLTKQIENYERLLHGHVKQIAVHKENMQVVRMESSVALESQKDATHRNRNEKEHSIKSFYEESLRTKDKDIDDLQKKLLVKEADLKELILKYNALEKKLSALVETQDRLRDFQNKVMNIGADANLLKNMAEMIRSRGGQK